MNRSGWSAVFFVLVIINLMLASALGGAFLERGKAWARDSSMELAQVEKKIDPTLRKLPKVNNAPLTSDEATFPRPSYDSGWVNISPGELKTLNHNIGGNLDHYVVDLQFRNQTNLSNCGMGGNHQGSMQYGGYFQNVNSSSIQIYKYPQELATIQYRVRIWVYN